MRSYCRFAKICAVRRRDALAADALLSDVAVRARAAGLKLAGVQQRDSSRPGRRRCDMDLIDLATGTIVRISEDRGNWARGCRMDVSALVYAAELVEETIRSRAPDLVILNKFAKAEETGGGMRSAIAAALNADIPVLMGVSEPAVSALESFAADLCNLVDANLAVVDEWLEARLQNRIVRVAANLADATGRVSKPPHSLQHLMEIKGPNAGLEVFQSLPLLQP
jgi:hypothetical protein